MWKMQRLTVFHEIKLKTFKCFKDWSDNAFKGNAYANSQRCTPR